MNQRIDIFSQKLRQNLWKWMSFRNHIRNKEIYLDRKRDCELRDCKNWIIKFFGKWKRFTRNKRIPKKRERFFPRDFLMDALSLLFLLFELSSKVGDTTRKKKEEEGSLDSIEGTAVEWPLDSPQWAKKLLVESGWTARADLSIGTDSR